MQFFLFYPAILFSLRKVANVDLFFLLAHNTAQNGITALHFASHKARLLREKKSASILHNLNTLNYEIESFYILWKVHHRNLFLSVDKTEVTEFRTRFPEDIIQTGRMQNNSEHFIPIYAFSLWCIVFVQFRAIPIERKQHKSLKCTKWATATS